MVIGSGSLGQFWRRALEGEFTRFRDRLTFLWSDKLSLQDILRRVASLPRHSAIVYLTFGTDAQGGAYADEQVLAELHAAANAPMFGALSPLFGHGIVGGSMMAIGEPCPQHGRRRQSDPERRAACEASESRRNRRVEPIFDWRELQRWGIPESRLAAWQRRAVSWPEPVGRIQARSSGRGRRADAPIAADRAAPVRAPRAATRRDRQPPEPGSRRRRQSTRNDVGADGFDRTRARATSQRDHAQRPSAPDDGHRQPGDARRDRGDPGRHPGGSRPRHTDHRPPSDNAPQPSAAQEADRPPLRDRRKPRARRPRHEGAADRGDPRSVVDSLRHRRRSGAPGSRCSSTW